MIDVKVCLAIISSTPRQPQDSRFYLLGERPETMSLPCRPLRVGGKTSQAVAEDLFLEELGFSPHPWVNLIPAGFHDDLGSSVAVVLFGATVPETFPPTGSGQWIDVDTFAEVPGEAPKLFAHFVRYNSMGGGI
jgi:hypothetical protein